MLRRAPQPEMFPEKHEQLRVGASKFLYGMCLTLHSTAAVSFGYVALELAKGGETTQAKAWGIAALIAAGAAGMLIGQFRQAGTLLGSHQDALAGQPTGRLNIPHGPDAIP